MGNIELKDSFDKHIRFIEINIIVNKYMNHGTTSHNIIKIQDL